jgi:hypothetical protein
LVDRKFTKQLSGLYLWSNANTVGKTKLCEVLSKKFKTHWWAFADQGWQQTWKVGANYELIVFDGVNSTLLPHQLVEYLGSGLPYEVTRRRQDACDTIKPYTPYIITSNKPIEDLGYEALGLDSKVWSSRMLSVCLDDDCNVFALISKLLEEYNIYMKPQDTEIEEKYEGLWDI